LTVATALEVLGPDFRFETVLEVQGEPGEPRVGHVVLRGGGDPTLSMEVLEAWADELAAAGVVRIHGVVADGSCFPAVTAGDFWGWGDVGNGYGSPVAGLNLGHNRFTVRLRPGATVGSPASFLGAEPEVPGVEWRVDVATAEPGSGDGVMIYGGPDATRIRVTGTVPAGAGVFAVEGAVPDPARFAAFHFDRLLAEREIARAVGPGVDPTIRGKAWSTHSSAPLSAIVRHLHRVSDNHEAECLFRMLGARTGRDPAELIRSHWSGRGLDLGACRIVDGSGLSRADTITPLALARLQALAARGPAGEVYLASLPESGGGSVRMKGGAMSAVRSWCGRVTGADGRERYFAMIFNHYPDGDAVSRARDRLLAALR